MEDFDKIKIILHPESLEENDAVFKKPWFY